MPKFDRVRLPINDLRLLLLVKELSTKSPSGYAPRRAIEDQCVERYKFAHFASLTRLWETHGLVENPANTRVDGWRLSEKATDHLRTYTLTLKLMEAGKLPHNGEQGPTAEMLEAAAKMPAGTSSAGGGESKGGDKGQGGGQGGEKAPDSKGAGAQTAGSGQRAGAPAT